MKVTMYADGGSRGNPGIAGSGTVLYDDAGNTLDEIVYVVGKKSTNNVAEYHGLVRGLERARDLGATDVDVYMDSKLVVEQMSGRWKIKHPDMQKLALEAQKIAQDLNSVTYTWVPRAKNKKADELSNLAMDEAAKGTAQGVVEKYSLYNSPAQDNAAPQAAPRLAGPTDAPTHEVGTHSQWYGKDESPTRFVLLRHGQTEHSAEHRYSGSSDPVLTETGKEQARAAAAQIAATEKIDIIVSSPMTRAQETAHLCAEALGLAVEIVDDLREMDFGVFDGLTMAESVARYPEEHAEWQRNTAKAPPRGESIQTMHRRVTRARLKLQERYPGKTVLVVTHVTPVKSFIRQGLASSAETFSRLFLDLASISVVEFYTESAVVRRVNETAHLIN
ncbi:bifunctional RNase H/acid phosphatase [Corynebacterium breve]|uniref:Bifunctional RNase H/acid phosphatase n=1 Tax=Corynebacterium breve TaxID=3049799 RepID=A0ABY8VC72_9CORY|nr:bifunctional RNase H/acid phosphatase [Corynebacterium breve]WIM67034.1 bifunctional RNase H/acid phosphatase [Corynebacterium breve]